VTKASYFFGDHIEKKLKVFLTTQINPQKTSAALTGWLESPTTVQMPVPATELGRVDLD
jgi:hypothetical protein